MFPVWRDVCAWLIRHSFWPLGGAAAIALLLPPWQMPALALVAALVLASLVAYGRVLFPLPLAAAWVGLALAGLVSLQITSDPGVTCWHVGLVWAGLGLSYGLVAWTTSSQHLRKLLLASAFVTLALVGAGVLLVQWPRGKLPFIPPNLYAALPVSAQGLVNANMLGGALAVLLPFPLAAALWASGPWRWLERLSYGAVALFALAVLLLTQSRGAIAAALLVIGGLLVARWHRLLWFVWPAMVAGGWYLSTVGLDSFLQVPVAESVVSGFVSRADLWQRALLMARDFPVTGVGAGLYERFMWTLYPPTQVPPVTFQVGLHAHNVWLQAVVDYGLPGGLAFAFLVWGSIAWALKHLGKAPWGPERAALWGGVGALLALAWHGLVDAPWLVGRSAFALWWALGVLLSAVRLASASPARLSGSPSDASPSQEA